MNYRRFGATDLRVSELGVGGQSLGGGLFYRDDAESMRTLQEALDAGINFFDTSDHYSQGLSEQLIGRAFRGRRDKVILATKGGTLYTPIGNLSQYVRPLVQPFSRALRASKIYLHLARGSQKRFDASPAYLTQAVEGSLRRLQTDYVDLYQLHKPPTSVLEAGDYCEIFEKLKRQGKIRYYGVTCELHDPIRDALLCLQRPGISSIQANISLVNQEPIARLLPHAQQRGVAIIARNPRDQGHLTDAGSDIMAETYHRTRRDAEAQARKATRYRFLVKDGRTLAQAALQFVLRQPGITTAIPRLFTRAQLRECLGTLTAPPLTDGELARIASVYSNGQPATVVG